MIDRHDRELLIATQRREARLRRRGLSETDRREYSSLIVSGFVTSREFQHASNIACYLPAWDEVDTLPVFWRSWRAGKRIFAPVIDADQRMHFARVGPETELVANRYGLLEPDSDETIDARKLDVVIAPLVAFDSNGNRIGMGGGYYDRHFRFLRHRKHWFRPKLIGLAFECQRVGKILPNPWDIALYRVFTEA